jgi:hypothetical protein
MPSVRDVFSTPQEISAKGFFFESKQAWWRRAVVKMDLGGIKFVEFCIFHSFLHPIRR